MNVSIGVVGIDNVNFEKEMKIYPNPTNGEVYVTSEQESIVSVMDIPGTLIYNQTLLSGDSKIEYNFQIGVYFIQFRNAKNNICVKKLIVQ